MRFINKYGKELGIITFLFMLPITHIINLLFNYNTQIKIGLYGLVLLIPLFSVFKRGKVIIRDGEKWVKEVVCLGSILIIVLASYLIKHDKITEEYLYYFLLYGLFTIFLFSMASDYSSMFRLMLVESSVIGVVFVYLTLYKRFYIGNYMMFGHSLIPLTLSLSACYTVFKKKIILIPEIICLIGIVLEANRSSLLAFVLFLVFKYLYCSRKHSRTQVIRFFVIVIAGVAIVEVVFFNIHSFNLFFNNHGFELRALEMVEQSIRAADMKLLFAGRFEIWEKAFHMFLESPIIGNGVGAFESVYNGYTHNIILDILVQFGLVGFTLFAIALTWSFQCIKNTIIFEKKVFGFYLLSLWLGKLMFSSIMWEEKTFWLYFAVCFSTDYKTVIDMQALVRRGKKGRD